MRCVEPPKRAGGTFRQKADKKCVVLLFLHSGLAGPTLFFFYSVPTWAKPWRSLGQALGGTDPTSFLRRSRSPDHRGHDAHRSTGGPPASSFCACIRDSANWLRNGYEKKSSAGPRRLQIHGYKNRRLDVQTDAVAWLHSTSKRTTHMVI